jgi:hypothetical protein
MPVHSANNVFLRHLSIIIIEQIKHLSYDAKEHLFNYLYSTFKKCDLAHILIKGGKEMKTNNYKNSSKSGSVAFNIFFIICFAVFLYMMVANFAGLKTVDFIPESTLNWAPGAGFVSLTVLSIIRSNKIKKNANID